MQSLLYPALRLTLFICAIIMFSRSASAAQTGAFSITNGYYSIAGSNGMITSLRLDAQGTSNYGDNTIASGGHFAFMVDGTLLTDSAAQWTKTSSTVLTLTGLPQSATVTLTLSGSQLTSKVSFSGTSTRAVRQEWDLVYMDQGYYQRATGKNYLPSATLSMPFESFYNPVNGNFRPVEHFKRAIEWTQYYGPGPQEDTTWTKTRCRGRLRDDVILKCAYGSTNGSMSFLPASDRMTLLYEASTASAVTTTLQVVPKTYSITLDSNLPLPEFYVTPDQTLHSYYDSANVSHSSNDLLTEFFQHTVFWWAAGGYNGGIWADWSMMPGCFMGSSNPHTQGTTSSVAGWIMGDDGYGHNGYAYTWGTERGWPFPTGVDSRHFDTNSIFITAVWRYVIWTGDTAYLNSGSGDRHTVIGYSDNSSVTIPSGASPALLSSGSTLGQIITATKPLSKIASVNPTWGTQTSGFTLSLYTWPGKSLITRQTFTNCQDNAANYLTLGSSQPAGQYYLEMSDPVGTIGWWSSPNDIYDGGAECVNGVPDKTVIEKARDLMTYQEQTLLGATQNLLVQGTNVGTNNHLGRGLDDVGCTYYDILPFGYKDNLTNITYYQSVRAMGDLEELAGNTSAATTYRNKLAKVRKAYNDTFWRTGLDRNKAARYIGCVDVNGTDHDFGYTFLSTMALAAGLAEGYDGRAAAVFNWLDNGESEHGSWKRDYPVRIGYASGQSETIPDSSDNDNAAVQLAANNPLGQVFFATAPFTSVASHNPTWNTTNSGFTLTLYDYPTKNKIATKAFTNVGDNNFNALTFAQQPEGFYYLEMSKPVGTVGWWSSLWVKDIYRRWIFAPRSSTRSNVSWWSYACGGPAGAEGAAYQWDDQLQNGGSDLYESGYDVIARARYADPDAAWDRLTTILRRYADPDRLSTRITGFYGEGIQGGPAGSVGWMWSEFPETAVLGSSFFYGFFGAEPSTDGLLLTPRIPSGHGLTAIGARNIWYQGAMFNLEATRTTLHITCTRNTAGKTFYLTGNLQAKGTFTLNAPLVDGQIILSTKPQGSSVKNAVDTWSIYE